LDQIIQDQAQFSTLNRKNSKSSSRKFQPEFSELFWIFTTNERPWDSQVVSWLCLHVTYWHRPL